MTMNTTAPASAHVINADSREVLRELPDNSVDAIITDPPYEIGFTQLQAGKNWDETGVAFDVDLWTEALRVLKPGGNLAAFGHSKTVHRLTIAIEDAGFEIRDQIMVWMYGQGMAKGSSVVREVAKVDKLRAAEATGFHTNLRPAYEPIVLARKPLDGSLAHNWLTHGTGGLNIDATRIATTESRSRTPGDGPATTWSIQRGKEKNESHAEGRWTPNVILCHRPDCVDDVVCASDCVVPEVHGQGLATRGRGEDVTRFFPVIRYQPKAPKAERPNVNGVEHSTVKPLGLMRYLVKLLTPPGGTVLDIFAGSGATVEAAVELGYPVIAIELDPEHIPLIDFRIARASLAK
jgi:hypothetical protein